MGRAVKISGVKGGLNVASIPADAGGLRCFTPAAH
jgi:hypothetical protein